MTINEILTEAFEKIKEEHKFVVTEVTFDVIPTGTTDYQLYEMQVNGKAL